MYTVSLFGNHGACYRNVKKENYIIVDSTLNIENLPNVELIKAYPNPIGNELTIEVKEKDNLNIVACNIMGSKIEERKISESTTSLIFIKKFNTKNWGKGIYFLSIQGRKTKDVIRVLKQ